MDGAAALDVYEGVGADAVDGAHGEVVLDGEVVGDCYRDADGLRGKYRGKLDRFVKDFDN